MMIQLPPVAQVGGPPEGFFWMFGVVFGLVGVAVIVKAFVRSSLGNALAERVRLNSRRRRHWKGLGGEWTDEPQDTAESTGRVGELEAEVAALRAEVSELAERVDFAERLLAGKREQLEAGR